MSPSTTPSLALIPGFWQVDNGDVAEVTRGAGDVWLARTLGSDTEGEIDPGTGIIGTGGWGGRLLYEVVFAREDPDQYQTACLATVHAGVDVEAMCIFGLIGELGELVEPLKKSRFHRKPAPSPDYLRKEIGDVLWYLTVLSNHFGFRLSEIMKENREKLVKRYAAPLVGRPSDAGKLPAAVPPPASPYPPGECGPGLWRRRDGGTSTVLARQDERGARPLHADFEGEPPYFWRPDGRWDAAGNGRENGWDLVEYLGPVPGVRVGDDGDPSLGGDDV